MSEIFAAVWEVWKSPVGVWIGVLVGLFVSNWLLIPGVLPQSVRCRIGFHDYRIQETTRRGYWGVISLCRQCGRDLENGKPWGG